MKNNIICVDPGTGGGVAWVDDYGGVYCAPNPYPTSAKKKNMKGAQVDMYQATGIRDLLESVADRNLCQQMSAYLEKVGAMSCDTPKTAASLNFNAGLWLMGLSIYNNVKLVMPVTWQNQLGIALPHGRFNYDARKRALKEFAQEKWGDVEQISWQPDRTFKSKKQPITNKTADALCMLWVYSEKDL